jgi:hypothetical protein
MLRRTTKPNIGSELVRALCDYLALKQHFFWRSNNVPVFDKARGVFRALPKYTMKGLPDIIVIKGGRFIGIEAKAGSGRMSPDQHEFARRVMIAGADYHVVRSLDDLIKLGL